MKLEESREVDRVTRGSVGHGEPPAREPARARPRLAIVIPCFNEEPVVRETAERVVGVLRDLQATEQIAPDSFIYFIDDGSSDRTWKLFCELNQANPQIKGLKLARNFGHQNALLAGLMGVRGRADCVVSIDADLQQDERAIYAFLEKYRQGADIVNGVRRSAGTDSVTKKLGSAIFYWLMRAMGTKIIRDQPDYRLISAKVLDALMDYKEVNLFLRGIFAGIGFKSEIVYYDERERRAGTTHYSIAKMIGFALDGITSFSVMPLRMIAVGGILITLVALAIGAFVVLSALRGNVVPGWASTVLPIYVLGGLQIMIIGLVAEYIGKIYSEVKQRPRFLREEELP
ncbi:MAG: glycosyltransferase family 2 protein [Candidatus Binataceae bacterium]